MLVALAVEVTVSVGVELGSEVAVFTAVGLFVGNAVRVFVGAAELLPSPAHPTNPLTVNSRAARLLPSCIQAGDRIEDFFLQKLNLEAEFPERLNSLRHDTDGKPEWHGRDSWSQLQTAR